MNPHRRYSLVSFNFAITLSPGDQSSFTNMPDFLSISLSEIEPSHSSLTNVTEPEGDTPIKPLCEMTFIVQV